MRTLRKEGRNGGAEKFLKDLKPLIGLPTNISERPHIEYVKRANELRGWKFSE